MGRVLDALRVAEIAHALETHVVSDALRVKTIASPYCALALGDDAFMARDHELPLEAVQAFPSFTKRYRVRAPIHQGRHATVSDMSLVPRHSPK